MTILKHIRKLYRDNGRYGDFDADYRAHFAHGYVFHTPTFSMMGFRCRSEDISSALQWRESVAPRSHANESGDCWFIWLAVGNLSEVLRFIPRESEFVAFARRGRVRLWRFAEITKILATRKASGIIEPP